MRSFSSVLAAGCLGAAALVASSGAAWAQRCTFLAPVGGNGVTPIVTKTVSIDVPFGRPNWNTDFFVTQPYGSYIFYFTADSSAQGSYPVQGYLKFTDGSNLRVINETVTPAVLGTGKSWGPFPAVPGKTVSQLNFKVGAGNDVGATGFTYRISTKGCN